MPDICEIVGKNCLKYIKNRLEYIKNSNSFREESITDEIIYRIDRAKPSDSIVVHARNENKNGADIEWWLVDKKFRKAIVLRIQAKKMYSDGFYHGVGRNVGNTSTKQIEVLLKESHNQRMIPLYCFYNFTDKENQNNSGYENNWTYASAPSVKNALKNKNYKKIHPTDIFPLPESIMEILCSYTNASYLSKKLVEPFVNSSNKTYPLLEKTKYSDFIKGESEIPIDINNYLTKNQVEDYFFEEDYFSEEKN